MVEDNRIYIKSDRKVITIISVRDIFKLSLQKIPSLGVVRRLGPNVVTKILVPDREGIWVYTYNKKIAYNSHWDKWKKVSLLDWVICV